MVHERQQQHRKDLSQGGCGRGVEKPDPMARLTAHTQPSDEPPPTSAAMGGGSGTAELGAAEALGADAVAVGEAAGEAVGEAEAPLDGVPEVLVLDVGVDVEPDAEVAGEAGAWKSVQVSVRNVSPFRVTLKAVGVRVYLTPSLLTT